jgi:hypothetical protein
MQTTYTMSVPQVKFPATPFLYCAHNHRLSLMSYLVLLTTRHPGATAFHHPGRYLQPLQFCYSHFLRATPCSASSDAQEYLLFNFAPTHSLPQMHFQPLVSGRVTPVAALETLSFLEAASPEPSSALRSRKPAHRSANDSFAEVGVGSEKNSVFRDGVLGVLWNGDAGKRRLPAEAPGRARPACSRCSSVQFK